VPTLQGYIDFIFEVNFYYMKRLFKFLIYSLISLISISSFALLVQYQIRLRMLVNEPLIIGFSKGAWVECLIETKMTGQIDQVTLEGVVVTDQTGIFSLGNLKSGMKNAEKLCPTLNIVVLDVNKKKYFVPFRFIDGFKRKEEWIWINPYPT